MVSADVDDGLIEWCTANLGSRPVRSLFETGHLSFVSAVALDDGREVVIKVRGDAARIRACHAVHVALHRVGFPCPSPIVGPTPYAAGLVATAEEYLPGGERLDPERDAARAAELLAALVVAAPSPSGLPDFGEAPPWIGWDHSGAGTWPPPDDLALDLNEHPGPEWVDETAAALRARLSLREDDQLVGHLDWESHNLRWRSDGSPLAVDDWDSIGLRPEPAIAGAAAAVFASSPNGLVVAASVAQTKKFLEAYQRARRVRWSRELTEMAWGAGLWVLTYNAKKEANGGGRGYLAVLNDEGDERRRRAGI